MFVHVSVSSPFAALLFCTIHFIPNLSWRFPFLPLLTLNDGVCHVGGPIILKIRVWPWIAWLSYSTRLLPDRIVTSHTYCYRLLKTSMTYDDCLLSFPPWSELIKSDWPFHIALEASGFFCADNATDVSPYCLCRDCSVFWTNMKKTRRLSQRYIGACIGYTNAKTFNLHRDRSRELFSKLTDRMPTLIMKKQRVIAAASCFVRRDR